MGHQTKINEPNGAPVTASRALARNVGEFAHDALTLAELQARLFVADVQECGRRALVPGLVLICGAALGLACVPVALTAMALLLAQYFEMSFALAFLIAALAGAAASALLCAIGCIQVRRRMAVLGRSQEELVRNLRWIKKVLERSRITRSNSFDSSWRTVR
jgi:hypothetical protein